MSPLTPSRSKQPQPIPNVNSPPVEVGIDEELLINRVPPKRSDVKRVRYIYKGRGKPAAYPLPEGLDD